MEALAMYLLAIGRQYLANENGSYDTATKAILKALVDAHIVAITLVHTLCAAATTGTLLYGPPSTATKYQSSPSVNNSANLPDLTVQLQAQITRLGTLSSALT